MSWQNRSGSISRVSSSVMIFEGRYCVAQVAAARLPSSVAALPVASASVHADELNSPSSMRTILWWDRSLKSVHHVRGKLLEYFDSDTCAGSEVCDSTCRVSPTADRFFVEISESHSDWLSKATGYDSPHRKQTRIEDIYVRPGRGATCCCCCCWMHGGFQALLMAAVMFLDLRQFSCWQTESELY